VPVFSEAFSYRIRAPDLLIPAQLVNGYVENVTEDNY